jgi:hypothetical protein
MSNFATPSEIVSDESLQIAHIDLKKAIQFHEDTGKNFLALGSFRLGKAAFKVSLNGEVTTNGISVSEFNKIPNYSFGLRFENEEDIAAFEKLGELLSNFITESTPDFKEEWDLTSPIKDDKIYIKLKTTTDKKRFNIASNIKLDPKKIADAPIARGQKVQVIGELGVYCNLLDKKAGVTFAARKVTFTTEEE